MIGNLVKNPEKVNGVDLVRFTLAVQDNYTKADGTRPVEFFNIVAWNKIGENCLKYLTKGSRIGVLGKWQNRQYELSDGTKKTMTELVVSEVEFLNLKPKELEPVDDGSSPF